MWAGGLRKTILLYNSLAHNTTWLRSDLSNFLIPIEEYVGAKGNTQVGGQAVLGRQSFCTTPWLTERHGYDPTYQGAHEVGGAPTLVAHNPTSLLLDFSLPRLKARPPEEAYPFVPLLGPQNDMATIRLL